MTGRSSVLILGAGINGAALARELLLNNVSVRIVDEADLSSGATARSSRLIHGGLRYLEYGEFDLVRESLAERTRLLELAPHLVRPLRLFIPVTNRWGGWLPALRRFFHMEGRKRAIKHPRRGLYLVKTGLRFYDAYARDPSLPRHAVHRPGDPEVPSVARDRFVALCSYYDAQICFPERFVVDLLEDARQIAKERGIGFEVWTYARAERDGAEVTIHTRQHNGSAENPVASFRPDAIVNATGAWVDRTLRMLGVSGEPLMGGTKGSHLVVHHEGLARLLDGQGLYAEAADGRPVFVLPFGNATLIGTTDIPYEGDPREAVADESEIDYLIEAVNGVVDGVTIDRSDVTLHYSGVRPLPRATGRTPAAVTRRHWLERHAGTAIPFFSVIGGKLTTCRSLAEESAEVILGALGRERTEDSRQRYLPGGVGYPETEEDLNARVRTMADRWNVDIRVVTYLWHILGTRSEEALEAIDVPECEMLAGTDIPRAFVRWIVDHEWVERLEDLVERRLMLLFDRNLRPETLEDLAAILVEAGKLPVAQRSAEVEAYQCRLERYFGRRLAGGGLVSPPPAGR